MSDDHAAWLPERARKLRRKYGALVRSPHTNLNDMLGEHQGQVFNSMLEQTKRWREAREAAKISQTQKSEASNGGLAVGLHNNQTLAPDSGLATMRNDARLTTAESPHAGGLRSPPKLPPMGTFEVTSPLRSPAKR